MEKYISYIRTYHENQAHEQFLNGIQFFQKGQYRQALDAYFAALVILRDLPDLYNSIGLVYHAIGEYPKALEYYKKAIAIQPDHHDSWSCLSKIYNELHNFPEAVEANKKLLEYDPKNYMAYVGLSLAYGGMGKNNEASKILEELVRLYPDDIDPNLVHGDDHLRTELNHAINAIRASMESNAAGKEKDDAAEPSDKDIHWDDIS